MSSVKTARRLNRILAMLPWVIGNPGASVEEVCERFDYTKPQLVADLNTVFVCGLPGYGPGDLMVAYIDDDEVVVEMADYFSQPLRLAPHEVLGLIAAGRALLSSGQGSDALERGIEKLERAVLPEGDEALLVDLSQPPLVAELRAAASDGIVTHIEHTTIAGGESKERDIEPWSVFSTLGNWYVSAYCRSAGAERVFRVDRIRAASPTGERFEPNPNPPEPVVRYTPSESDVRATIRLGPTARWVADYYPVDVFEDGATGLVIGFSASDPAVAARLLVRLGADAELLDGDEVAGATRTLRDRIERRYSRTSAG
jgi:proteasome accessory factor C